uniref:Uncharacterized protein n=1 Tax=Cacopsylla melanoneura TaxID=428564 RepID=A0A8D8WD87_9HEMI
MAGFQVGITYKKNYLFICHKQDCLNIAQISKMLFLGVQDSGTDTIFKLGFFREQFVPEFVSAVRLIICSLCKYPDSCTLTSCRMLDVLHVVTSNIFLSTSLNSPSTMFK